LQHCIAEELKTLVVEMRALGLVGEARMRDGFSEQE
jgi:hypothetical protein